MEEVKRAGRPRQNPNEIKDNITLRIHPSKRVRIAKEYGAMQPFFDEAVDCKVEELVRKEEQAHKEEL